MSTVFRPYQLGFTQIYLDLFPGAIMGLYEVALASIYFAGAVPLWTLGNTEVTGTGVRRDRPPRTGPLLPTQSIASAFRRILSLEYSTDRWAQIRHA